MLQSSREITYSLVAAAFISVAYLLVQIVFREIPAASSFYGHAMGILGFVLMLLTETLYTMRKRMRSSRWGRMSSWLEFHIFTGLVGPYLILLHTAWRFNGLAGLLMLFTILIVISGVIGRYIYTAVPRAANGTELTLDELDQQVAQVEAELHLLQADRPTRPRLPAGAAAAQPIKILAAAGQYSEKPTRPNGKNAQPDGTLGMVSEPIDIDYEVEFVTESGTKWVLERAWENLRDRWTEWRAEQKMDEPTRKRAHHLDMLRRKRRTLRQQISSLAAARNLLSLWHAVHIPLGLTMFAMAAVHIVAAVYYAGMLR